MAFEGKFKPIYPSLSIISAANTSVSDATVMEWCQSVCARVFDELDANTIKMHIRPYRHYGEHLDIGLEDGLHRSIDLEFNVGDTYTLHYDGGIVPDLVEAMHIAGLLASLIKVETSIGEKWSDVIFTKE